MAITIGTPDQIRIFGDLMKRLSRYSKDPVQQQIIIEMMVTNHCLRMGKDWEFVADSMFKHVKQLVGELA